MLSLLCGGLSHVSACMRLKFWWCGGGEWVSREPVEVQDAVRPSTALREVLQLQYSAEDKERRMFDDRLHACTVVIVGARGGREVDESGCEWRWWVSGSVLEGVDRCYYAIHRHTGCPLMRPSRARPRRRRTVRAARDLDEADGVCGLQL